MEHTNEEKPKYFECFQNQVFMLNGNFGIHNAKFCVRKPVVVENNVAGTMKSSFFVQVHPSGSNQAITHTLLLASNLHANESTKAGTLYSCAYI